MKSSSVSDRRVQHRPVTTRMHGVLDYVVGGLLFFAPYLFGFAHVEGAAAWVAHLIGALVFGQALLTRYELGLFKLMPMRLHLFNDMAAGIFIALSPWLLRFHDPANQRLWVPHVIVGATILLVAALTEKTPRMSPTTTEKYA